MSVIRFQNQATSRSVAYLNNIAPFIDSFEQLEREKLIGGISENLGKLISSVNALNRNIETNVLVGSEFDGVSRLWKEVSCPVCRKRLRGLY